MQYHSNGVPEFSNDLTLAIELAEAIAIKYQVGEIGTEQMLYGICACKSDASLLLKSHGVTAESLERILSQLKGTSTVEPDVSARVRNVLFAAHQRAINLNAQSINTAHVLCALIQESAGLAVKYMVKFYNVDLQRLYSDATKLTRSGFVQDTPPKFPMFDVKPKPTESQDFSSDDPIKQMLNALQGNTKPKSQTRVNTQVPRQLTGMGVDLTAKAREGKIDPVIGRSEEIERIIQILCRKTKNNPVLIGEPGVGKSAVIEGLCQRIVNSEVPDLLRDKVIFSLDLGSIMAGTKYRGALEEKLKEAIDAVTSSGNVILFIDELHTLTSAGGDKGEVNPADMLKPYLARGEMQTIGATTTDEYRKFIEKDKALERRFQPITVAPPTVEQTIDILKGLRANYEKFHGVSISDEAIEAAATLSDRYVADRFLPDKAIDLIDEASSRAKVNNFMLPPDFAAKEAEVKRLETECDYLARCKEYSKADELAKKANDIRAEINKIKLKWTENKNKKDIVIGFDDIADIVSKWTSVPVSRLTASDKERLNGLEDILRKRVIGQDEAIACVSRAIRRARAGLKDPNRPIGTFIFLGPTGVGKTELTKAIAEAMFDDENLIIRVDMSEYMESHSVSKLIGSPPGYVGFGDGGQLTEAVRRKPYSVVLFDEIEKAHPDVFNLLLQMLDEGRLTDSQGRVVSFKNTIIILTSNVGISELKHKRQVGFTESKKADEEKNKDILMNALKAKFRPEFLNRIDQTIIFNSLDKADIEKIASVMLDKVAKRLENKKIFITFDKSVLDYLSKEGYDIEYGARPLRRVVEQAIEDNLAEQILQGVIEDGKVRAVCENGKIVFIKD